MLLLRSGGGDGGGAVAGGAQTQFVALSTMKEALRREGRLLGQAQLSAIKEQLMQLVSTKANTWVRQTADNRARAA